MSDLKLYVDMREGITLPTTGHGAIIGSLVDDSIYVAIDKLLATEVQ